ncbi:hypothetical protein AOZ06_18620 [Kibdelosporangium phytohabitans]|uniref:DUF3558 domain-containing protein n=1 Tax=Kibdelosporangium phytohabitans TaxID=860235 RepID=A0A0N7F3H7_9PSEU|nr:hypothetical protein AOZ06_18620 [Kibdelosporangium phytohabitans]
MLAIIAIVLIVLGGGGYVGWRLVETNTDAGVESASVQPMKECAVSQSVLDAAKVSVNTGNGIPGPGHFSCSYVTRKGTDGATNNQVTVTVRNLDRAVLAEDEKKAFEQYVDEFQSDYKAKDGPKIGDRSAYLLREHGGRTYLVLAVLKGTTLLKVAYYGHTKGFFGDSPVPADVVEPRLLSIAEDLEPKLPKG